MVTILMVSTETATAVILKDILKKKKWCHNFCPGHHQNIM